MKACFDAFYEVQEKMRKSSNNNDIDKHGKNYFDDSDNNIKTLEFDDSSDDDTWGKSTKSKSKNAGGEMRSRIIILSGTLADKEVHIATILRIVGITKNRDLNKNGKKDLVKFAAKYDEDAAEELESLINQTGVESSGESIYINFWKSIVLPHFTSKMSENPYHKSLTYGSCYNYFAPINDADSERYKNKVEAIHTMRKKGIGSFTEILNELQLMKVPTIVEKTKKIIGYLFEDLRTGEIRRPKVYLFCDYATVWGKLEEKLSKFKPVTLNGKLDDAGKNKVISEITEFDGKRRIVIINPEVGAIGTNLQDKSGLEPIFSFIIPNNYANRIHQTVKRTDRQGANGFFCSMVFYSLDGSIKRHKINYKKDKNIKRFEAELSREINNNVELKILENLRRKGEIMTEVHGDDDTIFPGMYKSWIAGLDDDDDDDNSNNDIPYPRYWKRIKDDGEPLLEKQPICYVTPLSKKDPFIGIISIQDANAYYETYLQSINETSQ